MRWREDLFRFKTVSAALVLSSLFILSGWLWASGAFRSANQPLVLHWSSTEGITRIGTFSNITALAIAGFVMVMVNGVLAIALEARDWFWGKLVAAVTLILAVLLFITFAAIIAVN